MPSRLHGLSYVSWLMIAVKLMVQDTGLYPTRYSSYNDDRVSVYGVFTKGEGSFPVDNGYEAIAGLSTIGHVVHSRKR